MPENCRMTSNFKAVRHNGIHNGVIYQDIIVQNEAALQELRNFSRNMGQNPFQWECLQIYVFIPQIHQCSHSKDLNRVYIGHENTWCRQKDIT